MEKYIYNTEQLVKTLVGKQGKFNEKKSLKKNVCCVYVCVCAHVHAIERTTLTPPLTIFFLFPVTLFYSFVKFSELFVCW